MRKAIAKLWKEDLSIAEFSKEFDKAFDAKLGKVNMLILFFVIFLGVIVGFLL